jgi:hypothetical protein
MTPQESLYQDSDWGAQVRAALALPVLQEAKARQARRYLEMFATADPMDTQALQKARIMVQALNDLFAELESMDHAGKAADILLAREAERKQA